ncbi:MAG TPA: biotin-dependent carboxyltransferase family protein [Candidatus Limnocylindria bacterium]|nr:biotin-dependent carboxyltransferase family protein [Candidatus Limnocylindria bacterium]
MIEPGLLTTVQDFGRPDFVDLGVPAGGACDGWSLAVANALAGNARDAAALELTLAGPSLRALDHCLLGLAGADLVARVVETGERVASGTSFTLAAGHTLAFAAASERAGIRAYLAPAGGVDVPIVLGSASTCLVGGFGGLDGRPLSAGDVVRLGSRSTIENDNRLHWKGGPQPALEATRRPLRVLPGPHLYGLPLSSFERLLASEYRVSARGDRQGIVLEGPPLPAAGRQSEMLSQGVPWGAIQLPPDGRPICLLADHGTVGGYPVVAVVISADLPLLGQLGPGDPLTFRQVSPADASTALRRQAADWQAGLAALEHP